MVAATLTETYHPGELIFSLGETGNHAYVIESGTVGIFVPDPIDGEKMVATLEHGEIFGEMAIMDNRPRSASARALTNARLTVIGRLQISSRISDADPVIQLLIKVLMKRLRSSIGSSEETVGPVQEELEDIALDQTIDRMKLGSELERALLEDELVMHFQPIVDIQNLNVAGYEALLRWQHPAKGMIPPIQFVELAEESDLIIPIGEWVLRSSMAAHKRLNATLSNPVAGTPPRFISINVSARQFNDPNFVAILSNCLHDTGTDGRQVKLEITERALVNVDQASHQIEECKQLGCQIALDDFGTGYSSLSYLSRFPIDALKIDRSFVRAMIKDPRSAAIVRSVVGLANGLLVPTIAEGVETFEELSALHRLGCDYAQGYHLARPMSEQDCFGFVESFSLSEEQKLLLDPIT